MLSRSELVDLVDAHLAATGTPPAVFGKEAIGDPNFVRDLRKGREPREMTRKRVQAFIDGRQAAAQPVAA